MDVDEPSGSRGGNVGTSGSVKDQVDPKMDEDGGGGGNGGGSGGGGSGRGGSVFSSFDEIMNQFVSMHDAI
jgi:hypothetical protein